ncbi:MAG: hypothetical protein UZ05_CHB002001988 [Chlorobi bacterium OLB5]|nr:MAG: hypothetical protein UZ05_CHB002001988 [Chlorobi bacterium OLB5]
MEKYGNQLYIEGENNSLFIYFHLHDFKIKRASEILENYIDNFRKHDLEKINIFFYDKGVPGEHLSTYRKTNNRALTKIFKGIKCITSCFHYKNNEKIINKPRLINKRI